MCVPNSPRPPSAGRSTEHGRAGALVDYIDAVTLGELQAVIRATYGERDAARGVAPTVAWLCEEVGELAQAVRKGTPQQQQLEFGDVVAWVASLANQMGIDLEAAAARYAHGCPRCATLPCSCP